MLNIVSRLCLDDSPKNKSKITNKINKPPINDKTEAAGKLQTIKKQYVNMKIKNEIKKLLDILQAFTNTGNTVLVIEHNLDVIKTADHIIDMGPDGGVKGGNIIAEGKPEEIIKIKASYTGQFLKEMLENKIKKIA